MSFQFLGIVESKKIEERPLKFIKDVANILNKYKDLKQKITPQVCYFLAYYFYHLFKPDTYNEIERKSIEDIMYIFSEINNKTRGTFMNFSMNQKYIQFMPELRKQLMSEKISIDVLNVMKFWMRQNHFIRRDIKKNKKVDVFKRIKDFICKKNQFTQIQDKILVINYIYSDVINLFPTFIINPSQKIQQEELSTIQSLINLVTIILPKTMFRIEMDLSSFPQNLVDMPQNSKFPLIYINETLQTEMLCCHYYLILLKTLLTSLVNHLSQLEHVQQEKTMDLVFRFYYIHHNSQAQSFVLDCLKNLSNAVKFAAAQQIVQFINILLQIKMQDFVDKIFINCPWVKDTKQKLHLSPISKNQIDALSNTYIEINIPRGSKELRYIQIYRQFSLVYFDIECKSADINVRFVYAGGFYDKVQSTGLIFQKQRLKAGQFFKGSIEVLNPGIYYFEFDNSYSWITSKSIHFRFSTLASLDICYRNYRSQYMKIYLSQIRGYSKNKYITIKGQRQQQDIGQPDNEHICDNIFQPPLFSIRIIHKRTNLKYEYQFQSTDDENIRQKIIDKILKYIKENKIEYLVYRLGNQLKRVDRQDVSEWITQSLKKHKPQKNKIYELARKQDQLENPKNSDNNSENDDNVVITQNNLKNIKKIDKQQQVKNIENVSIKNVENVEVPDINNIQNGKNDEKLELTKNSDVKIIEKEVQNQQVEYFDHTEKIVQEVQNIEKQVLIEPNLTHAPPNQSIQPPQNQKQQEHKVQDNAQKHNSQSVPIQVVQQLQNNSQKHDSQSVPLQEEHSQIQLVQNKHQQSP